jgi:hypothetical protein
MQDTPDSPDTPDVGAHPQIRVLQVAAELLRSLGGDIPEWLYITITDDIDLQVPKYTGSARERLAVLDRIAAAIGGAEIVPGEMANGGEHHTAKGSLAGVTVRAYVILSADDRLHPRRPPAAGS